MTEPEDDFTIEIPTESGVQPIHVAGGSLNLVVGANGSGKSALGNFLQQKIGAKANRIYAHRQLWLKSSGIDLTSSNREQWRAIFAQNDPNYKSRWMDQNPEVRVSSLIMDLLGAQQHIDTQIANTVRKGESLSSVKDGPLQVLNGILGAASFQISIELGSDGALLCRDGKDNTYPAVEMSDGEKAALLLVSAVLVAPEGSVHLIDEPERHLHRSISPLLITSLVDARSDDAFVIFTHDLELASSMMHSGTGFALGGCSWANKAPVAWEISPIQLPDSTPPAVRRAILGGKRHVVFHEGQPGSLDQSLYETLLPGWSVLPVGSCSAVLRAVGGLKVTENHHWMTARGIVDKDYRKDTPPTGVWQLTQHEIENCFYLDCVLEEAGLIQNGMLGSQAAELVSDAKAAMRKALSDNGVRSKIISDSVLADLRGAFTDQVSSLVSVSPSGNHTIIADVDSEKVSEKYDKLVGDVTTLDNFLKSFPVRESQLRSHVASTMKFKGPAEYEQAILQRLRVSSEFRARVVEDVGLKKMAPVSE